MSTVMNNGKVRGMEGERTWELGWKWEGRGKNKARGNGWGESRDYRFYFYYQYQACPLVDLVLSCSLHDIFFTKNS